MSDIVEKTLTALPGLLQPAGGPGPAGPRPSAAAAAAKQSASSRLGGLIRSITALTSKHEEEKLIQQELASLKATVSAPGTTLRLMKECMVRLMYCEMLGYQSSFGYIHAIKLAQQGNLLEKRVGYLAVSLFLHENHELLVLLVNTVVKDLQSTNVVEACMALTVVSQVFPREMIPAVLPLVEDKLQHPKEIVRRKAVQALFKFYLIAPNQVQHIHLKFRKALCDRDVGVMAASLHIYLRMIQENSAAYKELTGSFVAILKQVVGGKLPADFNYHSVPAPWLLIQLLRILALLGKDDPRTSELMYEVLDESLRRAELSHNITYAILSECVHTIYTIHPKAELLAKAAKCIGKFVLSPKINLKYLGLRALTCVIQQDPNLALQHQVTIIECLDHPDPIIKRETLELLYRITNGQNVVVIVQKMLEYLQQSKEEYIIINLVGKIAELAEKYAPDDAWFIRTMNAVFSVGGDVIQPDIPNDFLRLLAEGFDADRENRQLRLSAVQSYLTLLEEEEEEGPRYPQRFLQVMSWVLGEYAHLQDREPPEAVIAKLGRLLTRPSVTAETRAWCAAAITKLAGRAAGAGAGGGPTLRWGPAPDTGMRQLAFELERLQEDPELMSRLLPVDASCEDLVVDASLSFLDGFVAEGLSRGAAPYKPHHQRQEERLCQEKALNFEPYGPSFSPNASSSGFTGRQSPAGLSLGSDVSGNSAEAAQRETSLLKSEGVRKLWGKEGYLAKKDGPGGIDAEPRPGPADGPAGQSAADPAAARPLPAPGPLSEEEREKRRLASTLFVGLGSDNAVSLLGKDDTSGQKFRRKSKGAKPQWQAPEPAPDDPADPSPPAAREDDGAEAGSFPDRGDPDPGPTEPGPDGPEPSGGPRPAERPSARTPSPPPQPAETGPDGPPAPGPGTLPASGGPAEPLSSDPVVLCQDGTVTVSSRKVWADDCLLLVWSVANLGPSALERATVEIAPAEDFEVAAGPGGQTAAIAARGTGGLQHRVCLEQPRARGALSGCVTYLPEDGTATQLHFSLPLTLLDFIRPLRLTTEDFGQLWLALANDVRQTVRLAAPGASLAASLQPLRRELRLHLVDVIGPEAILACQRLPDVPCLLHCRAQAATLTLWCRSPCPSLPDYLLYQCQRVTGEP
ncbi:AP-4 complex subunit epsilon-1 [Ornithorhynchus anatinus]|uniref:Adaptor related protein complex 4 subunit epsilon 1 n=1 Tax=Ornithorhynchus anatinus TaxID=9258 RepID=A0A6I8PB68_ORNAN|nr:AP-4 complex subunit epsilon-1 [Ornithorhynchus anatinus]